MCRLAKVIRHARERAQRHYRHAASRGNKAFVELSPRKKFSDYCACLAVTYVRPNIVLHRVLLLLRDVMAHARLRAWAKAWVTDVAA